MIMKRAAVVEQLKQTQEVLAKLLALLEAGEADKFAAHLYQSRRQYRRVSERPNKGNKATEREVIQATKSRRVSGSTATFAFGSTCCGFTTETLNERRGDQTLLTAFAL